MKKIYSLMVAAVAMFAAASCTQELENNAPEAKGETVVYTASTDGADTKAVLNETTKKSEWVAGDAITVLDGTKDWTFTTASAGANVDFSNSEKFGDYRPVLAVYPAPREGVTYTANVAAKTAKAYIPTWQQAQAGTYHSPAALAVAYSEDNTFAFKNAHALLKFTVNTDNVTHVIFHGNGSEAITGDVNVTLGEEGVEEVECLETVFTSEKWNEETQQNEQVSETKYGTWVECYAWNDINNTPDNYDDDIKYFVKGQTYYIAVAPQKFEGGVTVRVKIDGGEELVAKTTTKPVETKVNTILDLGEIKYEAPVVHEWAVAGTFNEWSTTANPMELVDGYYVAKNITGLNYSDPNEGETGSSTGIKFVNNGAWKGGEGQVTAGTWAYVWGDGGNIYVDGATADTAYDIYLNPSEGDHGKFVIVAAGATMPEDKPAEEPEVTVDYWTVAGSFNGWNSNENQMTLVDDWYVVENIKMVANDQFKFCANGGWDVNRGAEGAADGVVIENNVETAVVQGGKNFAVSEGGFYSLYLNKAANKAKVVKTAELPVESVPDQPSDWALAGTFNSWADAAMVTTTVPDLFVVKNVALDAYAELKVKKKASGADNGWGTSYGSASVNYLNKNIWISVASGGANVSVVNSGKYDVYFDLTNKKLYLMASGVAYDSATEQTTNGAAPVIIDGKVIYLDTNIWGTNANFTAWVWGESDKWVTFEPTDEAGIYSAVVPKGTTHMIFLRKDPNHSLTSWDCWNRTGNETIGSNNCFRVTDWTGHKDNGSYSKGTWSKRE